MSDIVIIQAIKCQAKEIAKLIIMAMSEDCCKYFHGPGYTLQDFEGFMTLLVEREDTQYSYLNTLCAMDGDKVAGCVVCYDGAKLRQLRKPFIDGMRRVFGRDFSDIMDETEAGEMYLDSLAVFPEYRHQGIASKLIAAARKKSKVMKIGVVGLLVDNNNPKAEALYKSLGFKQVGPSNWGGHPRKHMQMK